MRFRIGSMGAGRAWKGCKTWPKKREGWSEAWCFSCFTAKIYPDQHISHHPGDSPGCIKGPSHLKVANPSSCHQVFLSSDHPKTSLSVPGKMGGSLGNNKSHPQLRKSKKCLPRVWGLLLAGKSWRMLEAPKNPAKKTCNVLVLGTV